MSAADAYRAIAYQARGIPGQMGLRPHTVEIGFGVSSGDHTGDGITVETWTKITEGGGQSPKVSVISAEQVAVGGLAQGSIQIGPITPEFNASGTSAALILGRALDTGGTLHVRITGDMHPDGAIYRVKSADFSKALRYMFTCEPVTNA